MNYYTMPPPENLKPYVRCFWVLTHDLAADEPAYVYRSVADGCVEIVFHYQGNFAEIVNEQHENGCKAGLHFQSGGTGGLSLRKTSAFLGRMYIPMPFHKL